MDARTRDIWDGREEKEGEGATVMAEESAVGSQAVNSVINGSPPPFAFLPRRPFLSRSSRHHNNGNPQACFIE